MNSSIARRIQGTSQQQKREQIAFLAGKLLVQKRAERDARLLACSK